MNTNSLSKAVQLIQAGRQAEARQLLEPFIEANPNHITAWLWYAQTWPTTQQRIRALELCLEYNPLYEAKTLAETATLEEEGCYGGIVMTVPAGPHGRVAAFELWRIWGAQWSRSMAR